MSETQRPAGAILSHATSRASVSWQCRFWGSLASVDSFLLGSAALLQRSFRCCCSSGGGGGRSGGGVVLAVVVVLVLVLVPVVFVELVKAVVAAGSYCRGGALGSGCEIVSAIAMR